MFYCSHSHSLTCTKRSPPEPSSGRVHAAYSVEESTQLHQATLPSLSGEFCYRSPNIFLWIVDLESNNVR